MTKYLLEGNYTKINGTWHSMHPEEGPLEIIKTRADDWEKAFKESIESETITEYHIYITDMESGRRMEHRTGRAKPSYAEPTMEAQQREALVMSGHVLELPLGRDDDIYHVIRRKSKYGKVFWTARKVSYAGMAYSVALNGDDCLWCNGPDEAKACCKLMADTFGGEPELRKDR